jgi:hypothetical protein
MMGTAQQVVDLARQHIGYVEGPRNNETKFGAWSGYNFQPWCGSFINWLFHSTGTHGEPSVVWTPGGANSYKSKGRLLPRNSGDVRPGDVVFFDWGGSQNTGAIDHVGLVEAVLPDGRIQTIEGNTSSTDRGSQSNGGGVWRRVRPRGVIAGFGRPNYAADNNSPHNPNSNIDWVAVKKYAAAVLQNELKFVGTLRRGSKGSQVVTLQKALNLITGAALVEDGDFGNATHAAVVSFQKFFKLASDGVVGSQTKAMLLVCLENIKNGK